jgi:hypothetical protein
MSTNATTNETSNVTSLPSTSKAQTAKEVIAANVKLLIEQLEAGHSEGLTAYLTAMGRFHNYSFGNILEIARQRLVTYCYTSLVSINIGVCALLAIINGNPEHLHCTGGPSAREKTYRTPSDVTIPKIAYPTRRKTVAFFMNEAENGNSTRYPSSQLSKLTGVGAAE